MEKALRPLAHRVNVMWWRPLCRFPRFPTCTPASIPGPRWSASAAAATASSWAPGFLLDLPQCQFRPHLALFSSHYHRSYQRRLHIWKRRKAEREAIGRPRAVTVRQLSSVHWPLPGKGPFPRARQRTYPAPGTDRVLPGARRLLRAGVRAHGPCR